MLSKLLQFQVVQNIQDWLFKNPINLKFSAEKANVIGAMLNDTPGFDPRANYDKYEQLYYTSPDVSAAIDLIASIAIGPGYFFESDDDTAVQVCGEWGKKSSLKNILINCIKTHCVFGDSYALITLDESTSIGLQVLHPRKVKPKTDTYGVVKNYLYDPNASFINTGTFMPKPDNTQTRGLSESTEIDPSNMLHFRFNQIADNIYGISLLHPAYNNIELKKRIELTTAFMAHRDAHRLLHAKVTVDPTRENVKNPTSGKTFGQEKIEAVNSLLKGRVQEKSDGTWEVSNNIITDQTVELKDLASSAVTGIDAIIAHLQTQTTKALKVPDVFLGVPEGSNRAVSYNQLKAFALFIQSIQDTFAEEIQRKLIPQLTDKKVEIKFNEIVKEDEITWAQVAVQLYQAGVADLDEARDFVGLAKKEGEPTLPHTDEVVLPPADQVTIPGH